MTFFCVPDNQSHIEVLRNLARSFLSLLSLDAKGGFLFDVKAAWVQCEPSQFAMLCWLHRSPWMVFRNGFEVWQPSRHQRVRLNHLLFFRCELLTRRYNALPPSSADVMQVVSYAVRW
jgi:hypothetical protein